MATSQCIIGLHWLSQHSSHCRSFWANIPLNGSFCFSLAHSCSLWLTHRLALAPYPALAGSLRGSLWLFMALSGSRSGPLCHSLAHFCSFILLLESLLGSAATLTHFFPVWVDWKYVVCDKLQICFHAIWNLSAYQFLTWCQNAGASANWSQLWPSHRPRKP